jgi:S-DNA-T family DNA segregation ATPase FtsK/SpoIIIE
MMAKKKTRKETKKQSFNYGYEMIGILLILISIIGFMDTGVVGHFVRSFGVFLVGTWYAVLFLAVMIVGGYMIWKRKKPDFITAKLFGVYVFAIGILLASHINYLNNTKLEGLEIITETLNNFMAASGNASSNLCGGFIGACFAALSLLLFDLEGTKVVIWVLLICGFVMFSGVSLAEVLKKTLKESKNVVTKVMTTEEKPKKVVQEKEEPKEEEEKRVVVSSIDELLKIADAPVSVVHEEEAEPIVEEVEEEVFENKKYVLPPLSLLARPSRKMAGESKDVVAHNVETLERVLGDFGVSGKVVAINPGPAVTQYELEVKSGTKMSKVSGLNKEIALALAAKDIRIEAPIPGKSTIGVEIPNTKTASVSVREILEAVPEKYKNSKLLAVLGKDIKGRPSYCEINKTPHLLVAGSTGSGKSVCINSFIVSILMRAKPDEVKLVLVDPKKVEFSMYNGVPHLLAPVVTDPKKASIALKKIVVEMERRYERFSDTGTKNIEGYNDYVKTHSDLAALPYIVVIIDELADLMLVAAKDVEDSIMRITQMARAAGIHLIVATQRPSTDVITGVVKSNIPARISFAVSSSIDSRTILDLTGAEKLLGKGDMLYKPQDDNTPTRIQGTFISDDEIKKVVDFTIKQQKAKYDNSLTMDNEELNATTMVDDKDALEEPLYNDMVEFVVTQQKASTSLLQRRFKIGYNRAARAIDLLEERGIVGPQNGSKPREVLMKLEDQNE